MSQHQMSPAQSYSTSGTGRTSECNCPDTDSDGVSIPGKNKVVSSDGTSHSFDNVCKMPFQSSHSEETSSSYTRDAELNRARSRSLPGGRLPLDCDNVDIAISCAVPTLCLAPNINIAVWTVDRSMQEMDSEIV